MRIRIVLALLVALASGCGRVGGPDSQATSSPVGAQGPAPLATAARPDPRRPHGFADLPDRGDLLAYPGRAVRQDGAYTWHRAALSEEHALRAIADGRLRVTTPEGEILDFRYDRHVEHPSGDWTWIGHLAGREGEQTILTFGAKAAFGSIAQPGKLPLRLTVRDGVSWLVETDPARVAGIVNAATRPRRPDYHIVPESELPRRSRDPRAAADGVQAGPVAAGASAMAATTAATTTVDLVIGYTPGFVTANGGASAATTRLNYLVDVANAAYDNSQVSAQVRLVKALQVDYTDGNSNDTALQELSGYKSGSGPVTPNAAFDALRAAREQYRADLVTLVRDFRDPEHDGCGIAWLLGGGLQGIGAGEGWDELGYSVVSDGVDAGTDGKNYFCLDETLAHELGHNMGAAHDKATAQGDDGVLDNPDDYGAYTYSFGYKTSATTGSFYTVMAYGDSGQKIYRAFSNPNSTFCGGQACGTTSEDNARALRQTFPVVTGFRVQAITASTSPGDFDADMRSDVLWRNSDSGANTVWKYGNSSDRLIIAGLANLAWQVAGVGDFDGDGKADILWRNTSTGANTIWRSGDVATSQAVAAVPNLAWKVVGTGDYNGDGKADILWRNTSTGANTIWRSGDVATSQAVAAVPNLAWQVAGVGDFDGDGKADILWRNTSTGANTIWRSGDVATSQAVAAVPNLAWKVVGTGDYDGDGKADILWRNTSTGANTIWRSGDVTTTQAMTGVSDLTWRIVP